MTARGSQKGKSCNLTVGDESFSISLKQDSKGGYDVTNEVYTITAPEPGSGVLLLFGLGLFGLVMRIRIAHAVPKPLENFLYKQIAGE